MKKTILVADHSHIYLKHISSVLGRMGFNVHPVDRAMGIKDTVTGHAMPPDMIILDEDISREHLMDIIDWLTRNPHTSGIPVIVMSATPSPETRGACTKHGCAQYIKKPIDLPSLHKILQDNVYAPFGYHRKHLRATYFGTVALTYKGMKRDFTMETLSEGGLYVVTDAPLPVDADVEVAIDLEHNNFIHMSGKVIYVNKFSSRTGDIPKGMAIEFNDPDKNKYYVIADYVNGLLTIPWFNPQS